MKNRIVFIFLLFLLNAYSQLFTFRNFNHKNGLNLSSVSAIAQDQYGAIWLGTDGAGLQRFDGYKITTPYESISENEHHVTSIDPIENQIYFTSRYKGVFRFFKGKYEKLAIYQKRVGDYLAVKKTKQGVLIVGSKKIRLITKEGIEEVVWKNIITNLIQFQEINGLIFIISENESFVVNGKKIISIADWLGQTKVSRISFLSADRNKISIYSRDDSKKITVYLNKEKDKKNIKERNILFPKIGQIKHVYCSLNNLVILDTSDNIFYSSKHKIKFLPKNYFSQQLNLDKLFIDKNNDIWGASNSKGFFKISEEPFTKIELHKVYQNPLISFIYRSKYNEVFISDFNNKTYSSSFKKSSFDEYNFRIYAQTEFKGKQLFATNKGIVSFINGKFNKFSNISGKCNFVFAAGDVLFYGIEKEGLYKFEDGQSYPINDCNANYIYTAQLNSFKTKVYFGTNDGIYEYRLADNNIKYLSSKMKVKTKYSGVSTVDKYGTIWFTVDKSLLGIRTNGSVKRINNPKYFSSTLFYTLNSDGFGNIWIGTNNGINRIKLDQYANVLSYKSFNKENGFDGYETHMRSCFQDKNTIFIGTIEGLFMLNPASIEKSNSPPQPFIYQTTVKNAKYSVYDEDLIKLNFIAINPKNLGVNYTYRLRGKNNKWSDLSPNTSAYFANLSDQNYVFEVKSSYDGVLFSKPSYFKLNIQTPFWKSTWFLLILILSIAIGNFIILDRSRSFILNKNIELKNYHITPKMTSNILVFGFISTTFSNFIAYRLDNSIPNLFALNLGLAIILFVLIIISIAKTKLLNFKTSVLKTALYLICIHTFLGLFYSNIHPYYVIILCLCSGLVSIILQTINQVVTYAILQILVSGFLVFILDNSMYDEVLFLIAVLVSIMVSLFNTYVKNESLQKLIFTSSMLNNGPSYVVVFNKSEEIIYLNDSLSNQFIPKSITILNQHINNFRLLVVDSLVSIENFSTHVRKNEKFVLPMKSKRGSIVWVEWSIKYFAKNKTVMFGTDISNQVRLNEKYDSIYNLSNYLIFSVDINGKLIECNSMFQEYFSLNANNIMSKDTFEFIYPEDINDVKLFYQNQFKEKTQRTHFGFRVYDCNGKLRWLDQYTELLYEEGSDKFIKGFICFALDVSDVRNQQVKLNEFENKLLQNYSNINYLQRSLMTDVDSFNSLFPESSFIFKPKEIVSSNFYLAEEKEGSKIIALCNCSSEGIVSSILTTYATSILKECMELMVDLNPSGLLTIFESRIKQYFKSYLDYRFKLVFEITIVVYNFSLNRIFYACSGGKFLSVFGNEVLLHKGESKKVGEVPSPNFSRYNTYELIADKVDYLVLFTDGIIIQNNPRINKTFSIKRLIHHFKNEPQMTLKEKMSSLDILFEDWKANAPQDDDIFVLGLKLK